MYKNLDTKPIADVQNAQAETWEREELLKKCVDERSDRPSFIFYEGPPTANGRPGIHHVMARTLKDSVNRYWTMKGYRVPRKAGWDTHGLPVEIEVEKSLGFSTKNEIEEYGIAAFNEKCRESVFKYEGMWREMSRRMGFLADMDHPYITLANDYIETGWWIIKRFFDEELIYEGHKILPYCPRCGTGLASHEVSLGYKMVKTNTVTVMFHRKPEAGQEDEWFLAWTTTPWTLASNVSLTVGPEIDYIRALILENGKGNDAAVGRIVYVAKALADKVLGENAYEILSEVKGKELEHIEYEQLMPFVDVYSSVKPGTKAFYVTVADYATDEDGTGIVHTAPAFGEDDYSTGRRYGLPVPNPVDEEGKYTATPWAGRPVMEDGLDVDIIKWLAAESKLFSREKVEHNYPFCWRCDTPLIYYSKPSWYIEMTKLKDELVRNNDAVNWFPDFVGEKRFGNWIENVNDWAISRTRYWGTPIPIWRCPDCGALECMGSRSELAERSIEGVGADIELHRPYVDDVHITCTKCGGTMSRTPEVMDCWFDSGSMPYAQQHYPFENKENFYNDLYPADFICEGIDQTRGWFYSLMAISTFIEKDRVREPGDRSVNDAGRACYRNVLVNDLILDKEGKKMSKTKNNTADPFLLFDKYGADATRWYLLSTSPAWSPTRFDEDGLAEVAGKFFGTLRNIYQFFYMYANQDDINVDELDRPDDISSILSEADRWLNSRMANLISEVRAEMDAYDHMRAVRKIQYFVIEDFSNWYLRRSRRRFWGSETTDDKIAVYITTHKTLLTVARLMAPFAPFISEEIYLNLSGSDTSVHLDDFPEADEAAKDIDLETRMELIRNLVSLGHGVREKERLKVRQPLHAVYVDGALEASIGLMTDLIIDELNVKEVVFLKDPSTYMDYQVKPNFKAAGPIFGKNMKDFAAALASISPSEAASFAASLSAGGEEGKAGEVKVNVNGQEVSVTADLVEIKVNSKEGFAVAMENGDFIIVDTTLDDALLQEGLAREFVSKIQQMRKSIGLEMMDRIEIKYSGDTDIVNAVNDSIHGQYIAKETLADRIVCDDSVGDEVDLNGHEAKISIQKI